MMEDRALVHYYSGPTLFTSSPFFRQGKINLKVNTFSDDDNELFYIPTFNALPPYGHFSVFNLSKTSVGPIGTADLSFLLKAISFHPNILNFDFDLYVIEVRGKYSPLMWPPLYLLNHNCFSHIKNYNINMSAEALHGIPLSKYTNAEALGEGLE